MGAESTRFVFRRLVRPFERVYRLAARRLASRPDSEHEQAIIRILVGSVATLYMLTIGVGDPDAGMAGLIPWIAAGFLLASAGLLVGVLLDPRPSPLRRAIGMLLDLATTSAAMAFAGDGGAPLLAIYLWVIVGNGFRYGTSYLAAATGVSLLGFTGVVLYSEFWRQHPLFSASFTLILILLPLYVATLLAKLRDAIHKANEANRAKSQFLAKMSHELRTPLNGVIGMSDLLMDSELDNRERELARTIHSSANTLLGIINNILDFSKIESGRLPIEATDFDLHRLVAETLALFGPQARRKGIELGHQLEPHVPYALHGDPIHVRQILMNLVGNAVKFTETGGVELRVTTAAEQPTDQCVRLRFEIEDTGIGIAAEDQSHIFEDFQQANGSIRHHLGGTGLGTTIARELARLMGGDIGLRSELGQGTLFWVELPFGLARLDREEIAETLPGGPILVVGSGRTVETLTDMLAQLGLEADVVDSAAQASAAMVQAADLQQPYGILFAIERDIDGAALSSLAAPATDPDRTLRFLLQTWIPGRPTASLPAGFSGSLRLPLRRDELLNALHAAHSFQPLPENVVSLADHYRRVAPAGRSSLNVLVAEDNETNRRVLQAILERAGHRVTLVEDGEAALDAVQANAAAFDLMVLDKNMPGHTGLDVFRAQRFMDPSHRIPTIILSADATEQALEESRAAGVDAYLTKPVESRRLLETMARLGRAGVESQSGRLDPAPDGPLLDEDKLESLRQLGEAGDSFFEDLLAGFRRDADLALEEMSGALTCGDYPALRAAIHALEGSSRELGALGLAAAACRLREIKPFEMRSPRARELLGQVRHIMTTTLERLSESARHDRDDRAN